MEVLEARIGTLRALDLADVQGRRGVQRLPALVECHRLRVERSCSCQGPSSRSRRERLLLDLSEMQLPLPLPDPVQLQIAPEDGKVVARPLGAASALLPTQPLLDLPELSVTSLDSSIAGGEVNLSATATLNEL